MNSFPFPQDTVPENKCQHPWCDCPCCQRGSIKSPGSMVEPWPESNVYLSSCPVCLNPGYEDPFMDSKSIRRDVKHHFPPYKVKIYYQ